MLGSVRSLNIASALAGNLPRAALRLKGVLRRLWAAAQVRLNLGGTAPATALVGTPVIPTVRYRDVPAAIDWLTRAFGMRVHRVVTDRTTGVPCYAELTIGTGMLIVAPIEDTAFGKLMVQPDEIGGVETQVCYLSVGNARAHHDRAKAAGAVIVIDPDDEVNRGRGYSCRDPEGHVWNFGTYNPWGSRPPSPPAGRWGLARGFRLGRVQQAIAALVALALAAALVTELLPQPSARAGTAASQPAGQPDDKDAPARKADAPDGAAGAAEASSRHAVHQYRVAIETAERSAAETRAQLAEVRIALAKAERETGAARTRLEEMRRARIAAEQARLAAERAAEKARTELAAVERQAERARAAAARERARRRATARAVQARRRAQARSWRLRRRYWCYRLDGPNPPARGGVRLSGFCRG